MKSDTNKTRRPKRGQGEGTIYQRAKGRWEAMMTVPGTGKRKTYTGKTKAEVREKLNRAKADLTAGILPAQGKESVGQFLDHWLETTVKTKNRPRTIQSYRQIVEHHIKPSLGKVQLSKLTVDDVDRMLTAVMAKDRKPRTVCYVRSVLRSALSKATRSRRLAWNVAKEADVPQVKKHVPAVLTPDQARALQTALRGHRLECLINLVLFTGLRIGEVLALRWSDLDREKRTLMIRRQVQRYGTHMEFSEPKSASGLRALWYPGLMDELFNQQERWIQEQKALNARWHSDDLVFPSRNGTPMDARNVTRDFHRLIQQADLPRMRFHDLRHSCATLLIARGVPAKVVSEILGHSQISLTLNTYTHVLEESKRQAATQLEDLLSPKQPDNPTSR